MTPTRTIKPVPGNIPWVRADLTAWGETINTIYGFYRKTWAASEKAPETGDGMLYSLAFEGTEIWSGFDELEVDAAVFAHGRTIKDSLPARKLIADHVRNLMPVFEKNMGATHKAYMAGDLPAGAMRYTLDRLNNAAEIASLEDGDHRYLSTRFLPLASTLTMDLVNAGDRGLLDLAKQEELRDPALTTWLAAFDAVGMTARHAVFDYPQMAA